MNFTVFIFSLIVGRKTNKLQALIFNLFLRLMDINSSELNLNLIKLVIVSSYLVF